MCSNSNTISYQLRINYLYFIESEKELGLEITDEQLQEMRQNVDKIDFKARIVSYLFSPFSGLFII